jgi:hypothetical protein
MRRLGWLVPVAFFFLNPGLACGPPEPQYEYGAAEMRAAVEGNWSFTIMPDGASGPIQVSVKVEQAATAPAPHARAPGRAFVRAAYACGSRTLVKSAGACSDSSEMPLTVTFVSGDATFSTATLSGVFKVYGTQFTSPVETDLELTLGGYMIRLQVGPDGSFHNTVISPGTLTILTRA